MILSMPLIVRENVCFFFSMTIRKFSIILLILFTWNKLALLEWNLAVDSTVLTQHNNNDTKSDQIKQTSQQEVQTSNPISYNCFMYLCPDVSFLNYISSSNSYILLQQISKLFLLQNQFPQLYGLCDEMIKLGFRNIFPEQLRSRERKTTRLMHDVLVEPRKRWCR